MTHAAPDDFEYAAERGRALADDVIEIHKHATGLLSEIAGPTIGDKLSVELGMVWEHKLQYPLKAEDFPTVVDAWEEAYVK